MTIDSTEATELHCLRRHPERGSDHGDADSGPLVVLLHGITDAAACWQATAGRLDHRFDLLMPDARGHGSTPLPDGPVSPQTLAADVVRLLETHGAAVLIGHSMGAATAALVAAERPDLVRALVLEDPPWFAAPPRPGEDFDHAAWVRDLKSLDHAGRVAIARASDAHWSDAEIEPWAVSKEQVDVRFLERFEKDLLNSWRTLAPEIAQPTLLVIGDLDLGALVTPDVAAEVEQRMPDVRVVHLAGCGHSIHRDRPDDYLDAVHAFLAEVAA